MTEDEKPRDVRPSGERQAIEVPCMDTIADERDDAFYRAIEASNKLRAAFEGAFGDPFGPRPDGDDTPWFGYNCNPKHGPPCWPLITDPVGTLMNRDRWPDHVCLAVSLTSISRWTETILTGDLTIEQRAHLGQFVPVPIGWESFSEWIITRGEPYVEEYKQNVSYMPFRGDLRAGLILPMQVRETSIMFYGLLETAVEDLFKVTDCCFDIRGAQPDHSSALALRKNARAWWSQFAGMSAKSLSGGRPHTFDSVDELEEHLCNYLDEIEGHPGWECKRILKCDFVSYLRLRYGEGTDRTLENFLKENHTNWRAFLKRVLAKRATQEPR